MKYTEQETWEILKVAMLQAMRPEAIALTTVITSLLTGDVKRFPDYESLGDYLGESLSEDGRKKLAMVIAIKLKREGELENV